MLQEKYIELQRKKEEEKLKQQKLKEQEKRKNKNLKKKRVRECRADDTISKCSEETSDDDSFTGIMDFKTVDAPYLPAITPAK